MGNDDTKTLIRGFLEKHVRADISDAVDLFGTGVVNSLFALQLVVFVEKQFGIRVDNEDLDLANFNSINSLDAFVRRKRSCGVRDEAGNAVAAEQ